MTIATGTTEDIMTTTKARTMGETTTARLALLSLWDATNAATLDEARLQDRTARPQHSRDEDCAGHLDADGQCTVCGVSHTCQCGLCGGRGFHASESCPAIFDIDSPEYARSLAEWQRAHQ